MPVEKDFSFVADSTLSSSPHKEGDASEELPVLLRRPLKTYGRRQQEPLDEKPDSTTPQLGDLHTVMSVQPSHSVDGIPSASSSTKENDSDDNGRDSDDEPASKAPTLNYAWKNLLRKFDESDDEDVDMHTGTEASKVPISFGHPLLLRESRPSLSSPDMVAKSSHGLLAASPCKEEDVFGGTVSDGCPSSPGTEVEDSFRLSSPPLQSAKSRARIRRGRLIQDSDSEADIQNKSSPATASSSSKPQLFSPNPGSSSTQVTSEDEDMPPKSKLRSAGKAKAVDARAGVPPLPLIEVSLSNLKSKKVKGLTRKDHQEMVKERSRLKAQTEVSISRTGEAAKYSKSNFFQRLQAGAQKGHELPQDSSVLSDPIIPYSSPDKGEGLKKRHGSPVAAHKSLYSTRRIQSPEQPEKPGDYDFDSDFEPAEIGQLLTEEITNRTRKQLLEIKKRALAQQKAPVARNDSDDDLEVVQANPKVTVKEEEAHRKSAKKRPSEGRKRQLQLAKINPSKVTVNNVSISPTKKLDVNTFTGLKDRAGHSHLDQKQLNQLLAAGMQKQAREEKRKKEEAWQKHGGHLKVNDQTQTIGLEKMVQMAAEKGLKHGEMPADHEMALEGDEDESDEDWDPEEHGSASSEHGDSVREEDKQDDENGGEITSIDHNQRVEENSEEESVVRAPKRGVVLSDEEEENDENIPTASRRTYRSEITPELVTEEEEDKENLTKLMYDQSEDKENTAVVRHKPTILGPSLFRDDTLTPPLSPVHSALSFVESSKERRHPFQELVSDESSLSTQISRGSLTQSFTEKLKQASPLASTLVPGSSLKLLFNPGDSNPGGFTQFSEGEPDVFGTAPALQPGFSELFESPTQKDTPPATSDKGKEPLSSNLGFRALERTDTLDLSQDVALLQPAFEGNGSLLRKADEVFEKEQALLIEAAKKKPEKKSLYLNDAGFYTQTRQDDGSPTVYRHLPSQSLTASSKTTGRAPLRTISASRSLSNSPEIELRRLKRRSTTPPSAIDEPTSARQKIMNAFDVLHKGAQKMKKRSDTQERINLAEFVENEAAESDEEDHFFKKPKAVDDEIEGEDLDQSLPELMDDKEMDASTVAADRVHEKYMEQVEKQDKADEEFHNGLIHGEQRKKRRHGVGIDDSDEESETEDNERARRAMKKHRMSDRGDIKELLADPATRPFGDVYLAGMRDDDDELDWLEKESGVNEVLTSRMDVDLDEQDEDEVNSDGDEQKNNAGTISFDEIARTVRKRKELGLEDVEMDPSDLSWMDDNEDKEELGFRIKTIDSRRRRTASVQESELPEMDTMGPAFRHGSNDVGASSKHWLAQENKSRNAGTSRSVGGSAITGHITKTTRGSLRKGAIVASSNASTTVVKPVKAAASAISITSDKSRHFG